MNFPRFISRRRVYLTLAAAATMALAHYMKEQPPKPAPTMRQATRNMERRNRKLAEARAAMEAVNRKLEEATLPDLPEEVFAPKGGRPL